MNWHLLAYPLTLATGYGLYALVHRAAIAKVRSETARLAVSAQKVQEAQSMFEEAHSKTERVHDELQMRKWGGNGVVTKAGIIT